MPLHLEITVRGLSAHAARPDAGHDAIEATLPLLAALYRYRDTLASRPSQTPGITHPTMVVGLIKGGINTNVVPDVVTLRVDRRIVPEEVPEQVEAELREVIAESVRGLPGISVGVTQGLLARPFKPVAGAEAGHADGGQRALGTVDALRDRFSNGLIEEFPAGRTLWKAGRDEVSVEHCGVSTCVRRFTHPTRARKTGRPSYAATRCWPHRR